MLAYADVCWLQDYHNGKLGPMAESKRIPEDHPTGISREYEGIRSSIKVFKTASEGHSIVAAS
jgi:hypothetical protein